MVDGLHAEDSCYDDSDEDSSDQKLDGSNIIYTDDADAEYEVYIDNQFDQDIREEEKEGFFDGVEEDDEVEEDAADENDEEVEPDEPWTFLGHDTSRGASGSGRHIDGCLYTGRAGGFMLEALEAIIGNILCA